MTVLSLRQEEFDRHILPSQLPTVHVCVSDVKYKKRSEGKLPVYYLKTKCLKPGLHENFFGMVPV